ncbi:hypothetical protein GCM10010353_13610 [Streptomyces chryseus]|nr:hypothetical protein GCM10010353_13610 [Streptomyces chryseus]
MRDGQHGRAQPPEQLPQLHHQTLAQPPVQLPQRLVEHQQLRLGGQRPRQRDPLLLTARKGADRPPPGARQAHHLQQFRDPARLTGLPHAPHPQPEGDVPPDVPLRKELVVLEHQPDAPPVHRHPALVAPVQQHPSGVRRLEPGDNPEQRGLPAAARPEHAHHFVLGDLQVHVVERGPLPEPHGRPVQPQHQNSPAPDRSGRMRSRTSSATAHTTIRIVLKAIACP